MYVSVCVCVCVCVNEAEEIRFSEKIADVDLTELLFFFLSFFSAHCK